MMDLGLLLLRFVAGGVLLGHGLQKLTGWLGGPGIDGDAAMLERLGYRHPRAMAWVHGAAEAGAGALLLAGGLTPIAVAAVIGVMLNAAVAVHLRNGFWVQNGGVEYPIFLGTLATVLAFTGPGRFAVDAVIGLQPAGWWAAAAVATGLAVGGAVLRFRRPAGEPPQPGRLHVPQRHGMTRDGIPAMFRKEG